jgi:hypothetical protein
MADGVAVNGDHDCYIHCSVLLPMRSPFSVFAATSGNSLRIDIFGATTII